MNRRRKSCYRPYEGKRWPLWRKAVLALLLAGALAFGALFGAVMYGAYDHIQGEPRLMVILGCQVKPWGPSILLQDRLDKALDYLEEHPDVQVVVSGGQGPDEPTTEAQAMYDYLVEYGVEPERIWQEDQSHNTCVLLDVFLVEIRAQGEGGGHECRRGAGVQRLPPHPGAYAVGARLRRSGRAVHPGGPLHPCAVPAEDVYSGTLCTGKVLFV